MIPDYQTLMLPVLQCAESGPLHTKDAIERLAQKYDLNADERANLLPSGKQRTFDNRVNWAKSYLKQAGLVRYPSRGVFELTEEGSRLLSTDITRIDNNFLRRYESFQAFQNRKGSTSGVGDESVSDVENSDSTPDEILRDAHRKINSALAAELLERVRSSPPEFFELLIVDLLLAMGYGGTSEDAARALGQSGDNGVDGVVDQDPLGVDQIYVQAKRYAEGNNVGAGDIRDFFGALNLKKAQKGLFFTTSAFSPSATQTAKDLGMRIVLIDGIQLSKLMIRYNIGCRDEEVLHLKRVDDEFFEGE
jgi:restriction system protein